MDDGGSGWRNWMPDHGTTQLCGDTGPIGGVTQQYVVKACAQFVIEGLAGASTATPAPVASSQGLAQAPWLPVVSIAAIGLAIVFLLISGVMWLLQRRRSRRWPGELPPLK
jgi:hypothetical protein